MVPNITERTWPTLRFIDSIIETKVKLIAKNWKIVAIVPTNIVIQIIKKLSLIDCKSSKKLSLFIIINTINMPKDWIKPWIFIELYLKQILSRIGVRLHISETKIMYLAPLFLTTWVRLLNISGIENDLEYNIIVPKIMSPIPKYWSFCKFSSSIIDERIVLKRGEKERRGMLNPSSEMDNAFRKRNAEIMLITINNSPGKI